LALSRFGPGTDDAERAEASFVPEVILIAHAKDDFGVSFLATVVQDLIPGGLGVVVDRFGDLGNGVAVWAMRKEGRKGCVRLNKMGGWIKSERKRREPSWGKSKASRVAA
jgi:hypothetical protein